MRRRLLVALVLAGFAVPACGAALWLAHLHLRQRDLAEQERRRRDEVEACAACLPEGMTLGQEFGEFPDPDAKGSVGRRVTTVRKKLLELGAHCKNGVIYDSQGRKVFFYHMREFGAPPPREEYLRILKEEREELSRLEAEGVVVRMYLPEPPP